MAPVPSAFAVKMEALNPARPGKRDRTVSDEGGVVLSLSREASAHASNITRPKRQKVDHASEFIYSAPDGADLSKFPVGSLVKVELRNFQVSHHASFNFVPGLNMIIGPNGSGKSTVITALFLIFCGAQGDTNRTSMMDFITHGKTAGGATVWLRAHDGLKSITLELIKDNDDHIVRYKVDNRVVPRSAVAKLADEYNIQVNNTCQFLPQERVSAFAAQTMHERLISTLENVGEAEMTVVLQDLVKLGELVRELVDQSGQNDELIDQLTADEKEWAAKVEQLRQIHESQKDLEQLKSIEVLAEYNAARENVKKARDELKTTEERKQRFLEENERLISFADKCKQLAQTASQKKTNLDAQCLNLDRQVVQVLERVKADVTAASLVGVEQQDQEYEAWQAEIQRATGKVEEYKADMDRCARHYDPELVAELGQKRLAAQQAVREVTTRFSQHSSTIADKESQITALRSQLDGMDKEYQDLMRGRLNLAIDKLDLQRGLEIVKATKFRKPVLCPAILSLEIKNEGADSQVGTILTRASMNSFFCTDQEDWELLDKKFSGNCRYQVVRLDRPVRSPVDRTKLREYGFDGVVSDLLEDSDEMLAALNMGFHIDQIPYKRGEISSAMLQRLQRDGTYLRFADSNTMYILKRSRYGRRQVSIRMEKHKYQFWSWATSCHTSPRQKRQEREGKRQEIEAHIAQLRDELVELRNSSQRLSKDKTRMEDECASVLDEYRRANGKRKQYEDAKLRHAEAERRLQNQRQDEARYQEERKAALESVSGGSESARTLALSGLFARMRAVIDEVDLARLEMAVLRSNAKRIEVDVDGRQRQIEEQLVQQRVKLSQAVAQMDELRPQIQAVKQKLGAEAYDSAQRRAQSMAPTEVRAEITRIELDLNLGESGTTYEEAIVQHRQIASRLETLVKDKQTASSNCDRQKRLLEEKAPEFERRARQFVSGISAKFREFFARLGCRGEVALISPPLQFEEWGVDIRVSYREGLPLRPLSSKTQSGGEKAVATAVYLMALQGYSKSPFFVVDEINQGMDRVNERLIHRFIVETASAPGAAQYFLVTPKLLPDLVYNRSMQVLVNNSSPYVEAERPPASLLRALENGRRPRS